MLKNIRQFLLQAELKPGDCLLPATQDSVNALDIELSRLRDRMKRLLEARTLICKRIAAGRRVENIAKPNPANGLQAGAVCRERGFG